MEESPHALMSVNNFYFLFRLPSIESTKCPIQNALFSCLQPQLTQSNAHFWQKEIKICFVKGNTFPIDEKLILKISALLGMKA